MSKTDRSTALSIISRESKRWTSLSPDELLKATQETFPYDDAITKATTPLECLRLLILNAIDHYLT